jgi:hypothetical protein
VQQRHPQDLLHIDGHALRQQFVCQQHRGHTDAKRMGRHGFRSVWQPAQRPARAIESLQSLQFD